MNEGWWGGTAIGRECRKDQGSMSTGWCKSLWPNDSEWQLHAAGEGCKENSSWGGVGARRLAIEMRPQSENVWCAVPYVGRCGLASMRLEAYTFRVYRRCRERSVALGLGWEKGGVGGYGKWIPTL